MTDLTQREHAPPLPTIGNIFTGSLVRLGAYGKESAKLIQQWDDDAEFSRQLHGNAIRPMSLAQAEREITRDVVENKDEIYFGIYTLTDNKLIGSCSIEPMWSHRNAWVAIGIGNPAYRGKGYGTDAMRLLIGYGFRELDLQKITLSAFNYNQRAIRSYEKAGFIREVVKRAALYRDGQRYDELVMGILRCEWEAQQTKGLT